MAKYVSDSILLERFVSRREEAAFVDLVKRHGPRVEGTCRRLLHNEQDIEDVFQATFLVLARKAAGMPWRESVGGWLCAVAQRLAMNARGTRRVTGAAKLHSPSCTADRGAQAAYPTNTILWPTRFSKSNATNCARCSTTNYFICPKSIAPPSCCAIFRAGLITRPPPSSAGRRDRSLAACAGTGTFTPTGSSTAGSSWRPPGGHRHWRRSLPHSPAGRTMATHGSPTAHEFAQTIVRRRLGACERRCQARREISLPPNSPRSSPGPARPPRSRPIWKNTIPARGKPLARVRRRDASCRRTACPECPGK